MACYKFRIGNKEFEVSSPNIGGETPLQNFIRAIARLKESDQNQYLALIESIQKKNTDVSKPDARQNSNIPYLIQDNLKKFGINLHVLNKEQWENFCQEQNKDRIVGIDPNAKSFFLDGEIYVRQNGFEVGDAIHELSHLLLAVMRGMDFTQYQNFIHTMYQHPIVQEISKQLKEIGNYSDNYELDFEEESVVRYIEGLFTGNTKFDQTFTVNGTEIDLINFLNDSFKDVVKATFGITNFPGISVLFKSLICDIPEYGSDMFLPRPISTTGYKEMKLKAIEAEGIYALINFYSSEDGGKKIEKGECI